jgi:AcrR family transcriptional regulator
MSRWEPGAEQRLQQAAMALFLERGYDNVTVAEIAERAGLTRRTFFNYFADKREIFFGGAAAFQASVVEHLQDADASLPPLDAAAAALAAAGNGLAGYREHARMVRALIASSSELQERDLIKMASVAADLAEGLQRRGVPARTASLAARTAVTAFTIAWDDGADHPDQDFRELMQRAIADLRVVVDAAPSREVQPS